jgi:hypothetical protein
MKDSKGMVWLNILELESRRSDWIKSVTDPLSINNIFRHLDIMDNEKVLHLSVEGDKTVPYFAKQFNGGWQFTEMKHEQLV